MVRGLEKIDADFHLKLLERKHPDGEPGICCEGAGAVIGLSEDRKIVVHAKVQDAKGLNIGCRRGPVSCGWGCRSNAGKSQQGHETGCQDSNLLHGLLSSVLQIWSIQLFEIVL